MRFDDRLNTVLEQPASDPRDRAVRWRQLVDLVARAGPQAGSELVARALDVIRADRDHVAEHLRAAAARAVAALPLPLALVELFASDRLSVSAPVLAAAQLSPGDWARLLEAADQETRNFISSLRPELVGAGAESAPEPQAEPPVEAAEPEPAVPAAPEPPPIPSISDVVARVQRLRQGRPRTDSYAAPVPAGAPLFRWECGPSGEIAWVEGVPRGPLIGRSIARAEEGEGVTDEVERAFAMRAPFRDARFLLSGEGAAAGEWKISGIPAFDPTSGRFEGYRGIALREGGAAADTIAAGQPAVLADPDSLRELVHEIKTPLNAIIGFAEIIDGQYLGPADQQYRNRAAEIVAQARLLLSAIDDLDFAAKLQADRDRPGSGTDLAVLLDQIATAMRQGAAADAPRLDVLVETKRRRCALDPALAERLVTRFCTALLATAPDGAVVQLHLDSTPGRCLLWATRPRRRGAAAGEGDEFGFGLRLVRGLARIAGGDLSLTGARISLALPEL